MKNAIITGASRGIGRALSVKFARSGYNVLCLARPSSDLEETVARIRNEGLSAKSYPIDFADERAAKGALDQLLADTPVVDFAAYLPSPTPDPDLEADLQNTPDDKIGSYVDVILKFGVQFTKLLQPNLARADGANLVFISSDWALRGSHGPAVFASAKAGIAHFAKGVRREFAKQGTRVTVYYPGDIASFDEAWEEPKWDIDSPLADVIAELGQNRIPLSEFVELVHSIHALKNIRVEEVIASPLDGEYDY